MKLSLVIPVWNDLPGLGRLLQQVSEGDLFHQIIVVDDASDSIHGVADFPQAAALANRFEWLRSDCQRGAGHARNLGLERVTGDHVIFFDSDDLFTADFAKIVALAEAEEQPFDFLMFRHHDSRILDNGGCGMFPGDEERWRPIGPGVMTLSAAMAQQLVRVAAYPWNKIYRTDFLREQQIRCTETMVHNDVELHWNSFLSAERILATSLIGAVHFVAQNGNRLTNRRSLDRLEVFRSFENVMDRVRARPDPVALGFLTPFMRFAVDLIGWISTNIETEYLAELRTRSRRHFLTVLDRNLMALIAHRDPALAHRINRLISEDEWP